MLSKNTNDLATILLSNTIYHNDILLSSANKSDHVKLFDQVLDGLEKYGLRARKEKCAISVTYLGHKIDSEGLHPLPDKVEAIQKAQPRGGSRIYKRGGLTQGTNLLGRGVQSTLPSMRSMLELGGSGGMPP